MKKTTNRVGVDLVEIKRVEGAIACWGEKFLRRIYTHAEIELCRGRTASLAGRFAAKEAVMKSLGVGFDQVGWCDIEVVSGHDGEPLVRLRGRARARAASLGIRELVVSLSHSEEHAIAYAHASRLESP
ncbi:MAG: holo-ACP synthase [Chloroflexi bacterium]|nr:holo-ACP synthase [Chloroflexota bacterium]